DYYCCSYRSGSTWIF
nr:immunoglobulin light chain junction region [Macaca mulatta]MOW56339.1 immunoglobulin light chain junction region [Macaca mulatta]MOW56340.1 immunoglobulin light chain junction region [Macaca mulatta]MOW56355.1 immunoglobulin light chain junction region [Macaca mulatta]MOW56363.1 immunoglobulin light chain junction region [Macaca mulatta]